MAVKCRFHYDIEMKQIIEESIHFDNIGMVNKHLNLYLSYNLVHHIILDYFPFGHYLNCANHLSFFLYCQYYSPKSTFRKLFSNGEILDAKVVFAFNDFRVHMYEVYLKDVHGLNIRFKKLEEKPNALNQIKYSYISN